MTSDYKGVAALVEPGAKIANFTAGEQIGCGAYSQVFAAQNTPHRAIKVYHAHADSYMNEEVNAIAAINDDTNHIIRMYGTAAYLSVAGTTRTAHLCVIFDRYEQTLGDYLKSQTNTPRYSKTIADTTHILHGLKLIHAAGYAHGDIKPDNILVSNMDTDIQRMVIADFNHATPIDPEPTTVSGTAAYNAPELIFCMPWSTSADIWAWGCLFYEYATTCRLFDVSASSVGEDSLNSVSSDFNLSGEKNYEICYGHIHGIVSLLGPVPKHFLSVPQSRLYVNAKGLPKHHGDVTPLHITNHLMTEFELSKKVAKHITSVLARTVTYLPSVRCTAVDLISFFDAA